MPLFSFCISAAQNCPYTFTLFFFYDTLLSVEICFSLQNGKILCIFQTQEDYHIIPESLSISSVPGRMKDEGKIREVGQSQWQWFLILFILEFPYICTEPWNTPPPGQCACLYLAISQHWCGRSMPSKQLMLLKTIQIALSNSNSHYYTLKTSCLYLSRTLLFYYDTGFSVRKQNKIIQRKETNI